jgi:undecaprenyl diphosphate synthase
MNPSSSPQHIAIIMDGNGRWAGERQMPRIMGHREGVKTVREVVKACVELRVPYLTLYAFSQENWKRPKMEVDLLMQLLDRFLDSEITLLQKEGIRFRAIGRLNELPKQIQEKVSFVEEKTLDGKILTLTLALNYGSRSEIIDATKSIIEERLSSDEVNETVFARHLYTADIPDPDILVRTSGEMRLSNFLLWQCSYSEFFISKKYWPDFNKEDLKEVIRVYGERERRFGAIKS